ncbi:HD domain-containing protein [Alkaliphilus metalliredigens]|nr:HD domain-containing protein [Alkaliphilus metalliredigens]
MKRVDKILGNLQYQIYLQRNMEAETDRVLCRHNLQHCLDVARVGYIVALENNLEVEKELIYATALLHDIGRWRQYADGTDHAVTGGELAKGILMDCDFSEFEIELIVQAIIKHRKGTDLETALEQVIFEGDKKSRLCIDCGAIQGCKRFTGNNKPLLHY